jgi:hypothetical protein
VKSIREGREGAMTKIGRQAMKMERQAVRMGKQATNTC